MATLNSLVSQKSLSLEVLGDNFNTGLYIMLIRLDMQFSICRCLIRCGDTSKFFNFTASRLLVKTLWISLFDDRKRRIHVYLNERQTLCLVELSGEVSVLLIWTDE